MKRLVVLVLVLAAAGAALYFAQRRKAEDAVSGNALVDVAADWQHDVSRAPMRLTRLSDADEIRIGRSLVEAYGYGARKDDEQNAAIEDYVRTVGARVAAEASANEVLVSSTVRDLVAGSGLDFVDRGARPLKGVPGEWQLYAVA